MLQEMGMPSYVPVASMENMICTTNWTVMIAEMVSVVDTTSVGFEVRVFIIMICKHIDNFCALSEKKKNLLKFSVIHRKDYNAKMIILIIEIL